MTDKLRFTRAQIRTAAIIAKDEGVSIELKADGSLSIVPAIPKGSGVDANDNSDLDRELDAFKVKYGYS